MIIKSVPEDFYVEEVSSLPLAGGGDYTAMTLEKTGWNTVDALRAAAERLRVPPGDFAWGGRKDRHAWTKQMVTLRGNRKDPLTMNGFSLVPVGKTQRPMGPDCILQNRFRLRVRQVARTEWPIIEAELHSVGRTGFENYFGEQRFAGWDPRMGYAGKYLLAEQWNGALKCFLTRRRPGMTAAERAHRDALFSAWKNWPLCLQESTGQLERDVFGGLLRQPRNFAGVLRLVPRDEVSMALSAWQSHLWNEMLARLVGDSFAAPCRQAFAGGAFLFPPAGGSTEAHPLEGLEIPTPGRRFPELGPDLSALLQSVLAQEETALSHFRRFRWNGFSVNSFPRQAVVRPEDFRYAWEEDRHDPARGTMTLSFALPAGSFATVLLRRLSGCLGDSALFAGGATASGRDSSADGRDGS